MLSGFPSSVRLGKFAILGDAPLVFEFLKVVFPIRSVPVLFGHGLRGEDQRVERTHQNGNLPAPWCGLPIPSFPAGIGKQARTILALPNSALNGNRGTGGVALGQRLRSMVSHGRGLRRCLTFPSSDKCSTAPGLRVQDKWTQESRIPAR